MNWPSVPELLVSADLTCRHGRGRSATLRPLPSGLGPVQLLWAVLDWLFWLLWLPGCWPPLGGWPGSPPG